MSVTCSPGSLCHLGQRKGGTVVLNVRGKCTVKGSLDQMTRFQGQKMICVALYRGKGGSVYNSTHCGRRGLKIAPFKRRIVRRVGHLKVVMSLSRDKRQAFCRALSVDDRPIIYSRSSDHTLYSRPHGLASSRLHTVTHGKNIMRMYLCDNFLHGRHPTRVLSTVRRLGRVIGIVNVRRIKVNDSFSNSKNVVKYGSSSRVVGLAHRLLRRQCGRRSVQHV